MERVSIHRRGTLRRGRAAARGRRGRRAVLGLGNVLALLAASLVPSLVIATRVVALNVQSAAVAPSSAHNGTPLTLTVKTSNDASCVKVTGGGFGTQQQNGSTTTWTFTATAGPGNGVQTVTITAFKNTGCSTGSTDQTTTTWTLDNTAPTITGAASPTANASGWNNTNVTVTFTCTDAGSGIATCPSATTLSSDAANQSVGGTATDNAGNSASASVSNINIDKTAPTLSGAPTTPPNGNGWYNANVTVHWTCTDTLSGIPAGTCPNNSTIAGEGNALTANASVSDKAGNTTSATSSPAVKIDRTAPVTSASSLPVWNNTNVTVTLTPSDALSGVASTQWSLDGGATQTGTSVPVTTQGDHTLSYWSTDLAGNVEIAHTIHVRIDKTPPTISHTQSPSANANGWNNSNVTVTFTCGDALSGIASCTAPQTLSTEGHNIPVTGTATDNAGNTTSDPASVSIDKTKPTIAASPDRAPNASGWYNANVTVTYTCNDALSGVASCSSAQTFGEGAPLTATGNVADAADNINATSITGIKVDETAPTITGAPTTAPNANGWYSGDVTIHWTCTDALSGIAVGACPADSVITGSGTSLTAGASVSDQAGNTAVATSDPVRIDRTAPVTASDAPTGWQTSAVTVHFNATDALSGVTQTFFTVNGGAPQPGSSVFVSAEGTTALSFWSVDAAGNLENTEFASVMVDTITPGITHSLSPLPNGDGWNNTPVTVTFNCTDAGSGVASCSAPATVSEDGANQPVTGTATDVAGNPASDTTLVNVDTTPPTIYGTPDRAANTFGWYRGDVTVTFHCDDATSGVRTCTSPHLLGEGVNQTADGTATDKAGNAANASVNGINVDKTSPSISGAPTTAPNANGWYKGDVVVEWNCSDDLSGIAPGTCPVPTTITGEGGSLSTSASVDDVAGNSSTASVNGIEIDRTPPLTSANAPSEWMNNAVNVDLTATDNLSGVESTHYILDGGTDQTGTAVPIATEGTHTLEWWSVDNAGNEETHHHATVLVDLTNPTIAHTLSPAPNGAGWNNTDVIVTFTCDDQPVLSGVKSCTPPQTITTEGHNQTVTGTAVDNAGNSAQDNVSVSIDKTKPTITGAPDRAANANGWYNANVTVGFTCGDALSGIATCTSPVNLAEGEDQSVPGEAYDAAGNNATTTVSGINIDETAPFLGGTATTSANANGWYKSPVTVHWSCGDALSGIDGSCPADALLMNEGASQEAFAAVSDRAGNAATAKVSGINIDMTAPDTSSDAPGNWRNTDVTVALTPHDALSGVGETHYVVDGGALQNGTTVNITGEGQHSVEFWSIDNAGNEETHHTVTVRIDKTNPLISHTQTPAANANGWNNTSVTVNFHCSDVLSGVDSCSDPVALSTDGAGQQVTGTAVDNAGNSTQDTATVNIDTQAPTINASRDRQPNANDWYNADVTVSFSCDDGLSGVASCPASVVLGQGANQSVQRTVSDLAGNTASAGDAGINVDKTPPTISGAPTKSPNANGWYSGDVTIHWTCGDALSGVVSCPPDSTITGEGSNLSTTAGVDDAAGNHAWATVSGIKIDRAAPSTSATAPTNWVNDDVTVQLSAADGLSGVAATYASLDNAPAQQGTSVPITTEGVHSLSYWSVDNAGNEEGHKTVEVRIDKTAPTITHVSSPAANSAGWNNTAVTVTFSCDDQAGLSGIASCTSPQNLVTQGLGQVVTGTAIDNAGNSASDPVTLSIDTDKPTISGTPDRAPNGNGWYNANVKVTFSCGDALSGVASCSDPHTFGEGPNQSVTGTALDVAGNSAQTTVSDISVDKTEPTLTGAPTTSPNANGWYSGDVTVHWTCGDTLSGIDGACPADSIITGEGANLGATASVSDRAGNSASATVTSIKIDRTAPVTSSDAPSAWRNSAVTVHFSATDNLSGVNGYFSKLDGAGAVAGPSAVINAEGTHTLEFWSVDKAGNEDTHRSAVVRIDLTKPSISGAATTSPNGAGWYKTPVVVHFECADQPSLSGLASCTSDQTLATSGAHQSVTGYSSDSAGNTNSAQVSNINVDLTPPAVSVSGVANGATYALGAVPTPSCAAVDALSGPAGCSGVLAGGTPNGVGTFTYTATGFDIAGNGTTRVVTYQVVYGFSGFLQPINDTAHSIGTQAVPTSIFKAGSTVPVKLLLTRADGTVVHANSDPQWLTPAKGAPMSAAVDETLYSAPATSGSTYRVSADDGRQYIYNWSTKGLPAGFYYRIGVRLDDGTTYIVNIGLR